VVKNFEVLGRKRDAEVEKRTCQVTATEYKKSEREIARS